MLYGAKNLNAFAVFNWALTLIALASFAKQF